jgi:hypothetical protein
MMRRLLLASVAIVAAFVIPSSATAATTSTTCTGNLSSRTITTNVTVPAGTTCNLSWSDIKGNVSIAGSVVTYGITTFEKNVSVVGGSFVSVNHGATIDGNLSFLDPAANSQSGFWPPEDATINLVKGNLSYTIDSNVSYPCYQWPALYLGSVTVDGNFNYTGYTFSSHLDTSGLTLLGSESVTSVSPQSC